ncbi:MAG: hypothetical protein ABIB11_06170 [Candidatus Omnitrophota bacterium]
MKQRDVDREILIACVLGDGCLVQHAKQGTNWLKLIQSPVQRDYLMWKVGLIESTSFVKGKRFTIRFRTDRHSNGKIYPAITANMYGVKYFRVLRKWIYPEGKKTVRNVLQYLSLPISLAIMFMDDGSVNRRFRKHKDGSKFFLKPSMRLALCRELDDCAAFLAWMLERFGIEGYPMRHSRKDAPQTYYVLNFNAANTRKIWEIIGPFAAGLQSMSKKFDLCFNVLPQVARVPGILVG